MKIDSVYSDTITSYSCSCLHALYVATYVAIAIYIKVYMIHHFCACNHDWYVNYTLH